jgi:hypothetical protein
LIALALAVPALPAAAQTTPMETSAAQPVSAMATAFVAIFLDEDSMVARVDRDVPAVYRASPKFHALEVDYPGITDYVIGRILPSSKRRVVERLHRMSSPIAAYLSAHIAEADLARVVDFYRSPVGAKMVGILRQMDGAPMLQSMAPKLGKATGQDLEKSAASTIAANGGIAKKFTDSELDEITRFLATDAGKKWTAIQPSFYAAMAELSNEDAQKSLPAIRAEVGSVIADYEREHPKKVSQ